MILRTATKYLRTVTKESIEKNQDHRKEFTYKSHRTSPNYKPSDLVWVKLHLSSTASQGKSAKLMPTKDVSYIILFQKSPTTFAVAN